MLMKASRTATRAVVLIFCIFLLPAMGNGADKPCHMCHKSKIVGTYVHAPVADKDCVACHKSGGSAHQTNKELNGVKKPGAALCYDCHDTLNQLKSVHGPIKNNDCGGCHAPHVSPYRKLLRAAPADFCFKCHERQMFTKPVPHEPVAAGRCTDCHVPHQSTVAYLIKPTKELICYECHDSGISRGKSVHVPVFDKDCAGCHNIHGSDHTKLLKASPTELCFICHDKKNYQKASTHDPVISGRCSDCHLPHQSDMRNLLKFKTKPMCLECHDPQIAQGVSIHMPVKACECDVCHDVHASETGKLLKAAYPMVPEIAYSDAAYALCIECHGKAAYSEDENTSDTRFRDGKTNLHALHVKGASVTCRMCHNPHASPQAKLFPDTVVGKDNMPIMLNFTPDIRGGSCKMTCHSPATYKH